MIDNKKRHRYLLEMLLFKLFFILISLSYSKESHLLYQETKIGSDSQFNPISYYFNEAFDTIQNPTYFSQKDFFKKHEIVWKRVRDPFLGIKEGGGLKVLLHDEFVPYAPRAAPNYSLHLIGGGNDYRRLAEWFDQNNYSHPYLWAFFSQYAAAFGNEAMEATNTKDIGPHDHIADLYFFDLVGKFLFMNDDVVLFFRDKAQLKAWPFQPVFNLKQDHVMNAASNFIARPDLFNANCRPFIHVGLQLLGGISCLKNSRGLSAGMGIAPTDPLRNKARLVTGFFWDEEGSLMSSLFINGGEDQHLRLNIFPGVLKWSSLSPGFFSAWARNNDLQIGAQVIIPVGLGLNF